jgi:shikimate dehydrogenase
MHHHTITAQTTLCCLLGNPVEHSLSPALHNACFRHCGLDWVYVAFCVQDIGAAIAGIRALGIRGASVTIPHKISAVRYLDSLDAAAQVVGSINTIVNDTGVLRGFNSDGLGALQALREHGHDPTGKRVTVLGSGGAARAIAITLALTARPERLVIGGIVTEEMDRLKQDIGAASDCMVQTVTLTDEVLREILPETDILINATPVGMYPNVQKTPIPRNLLEKHHVVFDVVYNPRVTRLLADARRAGARIVSGLEMFLNQAAVQFELWTGRPAPRAVMRRVVLNHLRLHQPRGKNP